VAAFLLAPGAVCAQSALADDSSTPADSSNSPDVTAVPSGFTPGTPASSFVPYVAPTEAQKFHSFEWNAFGPIAFAGSSFAAAINQASDFPHAWGQGAGAYGERVASNLGISLVTATAQYSMAEVLHEDTEYYRCTCSGFLRRFWHAGLSSVTARRGSDGYTSFSYALTVSPFIGPLVAANTWMPGRNGPIVGLRMGAFNLLGQFGQNETLEFLYGGPHTLLGRIQRRFFKNSSDADH